MKATVVEHTVWVIDTLCWRCTSSVRVELAFSSLKCYVTFGTQGRTCDLPVGLDIWDKVVSSPFSSSMVQWDWPEWFISSMLPGRVHRVRWSPHWSIGDEWFSRLIHWPISRSNSEPSATLPGHWRSKPCKTSNITVYLKNFLNSKNVFTTWKWEMQF